MPWASDLEMNAESQEDWAPAYVNKIPINHLISTASSCPEGLAETFNRVSWDLANI